MSGAVLILSGPSGAGKSTIIEKASRYIGEYHFSISTTTRAPREGEKDGVDYYFVDREEFEREIEAGEFLEYAVVHGNYYGTSLKPVKKALNDGKLVIFDIDVQGHRIAREKLGRIVTSIFITPPTLSELRRRLERRSTDDEKTIKRRIENAREEIEDISLYDFIIVNDNLEKAVDFFVSIAKVARMKMDEDEIEEFVKGWKEEYLV
jgi:guanylate kinase